MTWNINLSDESEEIIKIIDKASNHEKRTLMLTWMDNFKKKLEDNITDLDGCDMVVLGCVSSIANEHNVPLFNKIVKRISEGTMTE